MRVLANGLRLEAESLGDPAAPAVLLVLGLGMQLVAWPDELCRALVDSGYRVIRFDNRDAGLRQRSGWLAASACATIAPRDTPTRCAWRAPIASITPSASSAMASSV